ncbi:MAG: hypothetical protein HY074_09935 [Deltaproteobacteria bacterium]|nr:hypothetical protein [Deltaproteobacteria bacterium]
MNFVGYAGIVFIFLLSFASAQAAAVKWAHSKDEVFGYEVDYPSDWQVSSPRLHRIRLPLYDGPMVVRGSRLFTKFKDGKVSLQIRIAPLLKRDSLGNLFKAVQSRGAEIRELDYKIGGVVARYIVGTSKHPHPHDIFFRHENVIFSVSAIADENIPGEMELVFERMLHSLKFSGAPSESGIQAHFNRTDDLAHPERFQWQKRANKIHGYELEFSKEWGFDGVATFTERRGANTCPGCCTVRVSVYEANDLTVDAFAERHLSEVEQRQGKIDSAGLLDFRPTLAKRRREKVPFRIGGEPAMRYPVERPGNNYNKVIDDIIFKHGDRFYDINRVCVHALQIQFSELSEHLMRSFRFTNGPKQPILQNIGQNEAALR